MTNLMEWSRFSRRHYWTWEWVTYRFGIFASTRWALSLRHKAKHQKIVQVSTDVSMILLTTWPNKGCSRSVRKVTVSNRNISFVKIITNFHFKIHISSLYTARNTETLLCTRLKKKHDFRICHGNEKYNPSTVCKEVSCATFRTE